MRILIADDHPVVHRGVRASLNRIWATHQGIRDEDENRRGIGQGGRGGDERRNLL